LPVLFIVICVVPFQAGEKSDQRVVELASKNPSANYDSLYL